MPAGLVPAGPPIGALVVPAHPVSEMAAEQRKATALFFGVIPETRSLENLI
jgi:hypothetical protein